mmetsp:Transcript_22292/g.43954  ORF Transcript_22292/g.43954 Transcript_22292/m.43954 type:complete len:247 (+) Transcript_22292:735-1475(+)
MASSRARYSDGGRLLRRAGTCSSEENRRGLILRSPRQREESIGQGSSCQCEEIGQEGGQGGCGGGGSSGSSRSGGPCVVVVASGGASLTRCHARSSWGRGGGGALDRESTRGGSHVFARRRPLQRLVAVLVVLAKPPARVGLAANGALVLGRFRRSSRWQGRALLPAGPESAQGVAGGARTVRRRSRRKRGKEADEESGDPGRIGHGGHRLDLCCCCVLGKGPPRQQAREGVSLVAALHGAAPARG